MKHRLFLSAILMMALAIPQSVGAWNHSAASPSGQTLYYNIGDGVAVVTETGARPRQSYVSGSLIIPSNVTYNGNVYPVVAIGNQAFAECDITSVIIPNTVTSIGYRAFGACTSLTSITLPDSLQSIGEAAFSGCESLTSLVIPNTVTTIGMYPFSGCSSLTSITLPDALTSVGYAFFSDCTSLTSVILGSNITSIEYNAFHNCTSLTNITLPDAVTTIGAQAFANCTSLNSINLGSSMTTIGVSAFFGCSNLTSIVIPNTVTEIGDIAFMNCSSLVSVVIGSSVGQIVSGTFNGCTSLTSIIVDENNTVLDSRDNCNGVIWTEYNSLIMGCPHTIIPSSVTYIGSDAFAGHGTIETLTINATTPPTNGQSSIPVGITLNVPCGTYDTYYSSWGSNYTYVEPNAPLNLFVAVNDSSRGTASTIIQYSGNSIRCTDSICRVEAIPYYGYRFDHWNNGSTLYQCDFKLASDSVVTAFFFPERYFVGGTADSSKGWVSGSDTVDYLDTVLLQATPNYGYHFTHWSDGVTTNPRYVAATGNLIVNALFESNTYTISTIVMEDTSIINGLYNDTLALNPIITMGYHFVSWSDSCTVIPRLIKLTKDTAFEVICGINQYSLSVISNDESLGVVSGSGSYNYLDSVIITATSLMEHYNFQTWSDGSLDNPRTIVITSDSALTANFALRWHNVAVQPDEVTHGLTYGQGQYEYGSSATIQAEPFSGYYFSHWSNGATFNPYTFYVDCDTLLTAIFTAFGEPYQDTIIVFDTLLYSIHDTTFIMLTDTVTEYVQVHDTTYIILTDTVTNTIFDTVFNTMYDTIDNYIYDTTLVTVTDTLWLTEYDTLYITLYDTVYLHDTVYLGVDVAENTMAKVYVREGRIVVETEEGMQVWVYDVTGRRIQPARMPAFPGNTVVDVPASGTYLVKVGEAPARRVVVVR